MTAFPGSTTAGGPSGPRAGFGRRFVAVLVDSILLSIVYGVALTILGETVAYLVSVVGGLAYYAYLEGSASGQTVGKKALGIRVVDFRSGAPIGFGRALVRYIGRIISAIPCALGYLWMLWDPQQQTWHDKLVSTTVVPVSAYPV